MSLSCGMNRVQWAGKFTTQKGRSIRKVYQLGSKETHIHAIKAFEPSFLFTIAKHVPLCSRNLRLGEIICKKIAL